MKLKNSSKISTEQRTESKIKDAFINTYEHDNGEIERVMAVTANSWDDLSFVHPGFSFSAYQKIVNLYRNFIVPKAPVVFGQMALYHIPGDFEFPKEIHLDFKDLNETDETALDNYLRQNVRIKKGIPVFKTDIAKRIWNELDASNSISIVCGKLPFTKFLQVGSDIGYLSDEKDSYEAVVNASFFVMDAFDVSGSFDKIGTPLGLLVKDGVVYNPPLFNREALIVYNDNSVEIKSPSTSELTLEISGKAFIPGQNCSIYDRPDYFKISIGKDKIAVVIIGNKVARVNMGKTETVPESGFILVVDKDTEIHPLDEVSYKGMEDVKFGISVGNSIIRNGVKTTEFISKFYNIKKHLGRKAYPPSLYPLDFENARAPRIALGSDKDGLPIIIWAEGPGKTGYTKGVDSAGASLLEMADICEDLGIKNAVNLDGGGSAQIILNGKRYLMISDRNPSDNSEAERAVPVGIGI